MKEKQGGACNHTNPGSGITSKTPCKKWVTTSKRPALSAGVMGFLKRAESQDISLYLEGTWRDAEGPIWQNEPLSLIKI